MLPAVLRDVGIAFQDGRDPVFGENAPSVNTRWMGSCCCVRHTGPLAPISKAPGLRGQTLLWEVKLVSFLVNGDALGGLLSEPSSWNILLSSIQPRPLLKTFHSMGGYLEAKKLSESQGSEGLRVAMRYAYAAW